MSKYLLIESRDTYEHAEDVAALKTQRNVPIYYVEEDASERGLGESDRIDLGEPVPRSGLSKFVVAYGRVFRW